MILPGHVETLIVGAGFAGLGLAARMLRDDPAADLAVIERAGGVGGTWRANTYPGCACDVPTALYSYSFAPSARWSHNFARQPEILAYLQQVAAATGVENRVVLDCELLSADWDDDAALWRVQTSSGSSTARVLVAATGALSAPKAPDLPGFERFTGTTFHSSTWNHEHDLRGRRVAVIGTGASAVQFVPEIADEAAHVTVFQRTPAWVLPRLDRVLPDRQKALYERVPMAQKAVRAAIYAYRESLGAAMSHATWVLPAFETLARTHLRAQVKDPELRRTLTPDFTIGCKRILLSNDWLRTLDRSDVTLVDRAVAALTESGVVDGDGVEHEADTVIFATGFTPTEPPVAHVISAADGTSLAQHWNGSPSAYKGTTVSGFPNLFLLYGPNTNLGHSSIVYMLELQAEYVNDAVTTMKTAGLQVVDVTERAQKVYNRGVQRALRRTVWNKGGCASWYLDRDGRNSVQWPTFTFTFRSRLRRFDLENYTSRKVESHPVR